MLKELLEEKYYYYNTKDFIVDDPISVPHRFAIKENIEIAGFLTATLAWGKRSTIIESANRLLGYMGNQPYSFVLESSDAEIRMLSKFIHRTFNGVDAVFFIQSLRNIYVNHGGLGVWFSKAYKTHQSIKSALIQFHKVFFEVPYPKRTQKHIANIAKGAAAKRLNMFLRWMVRMDTSGVDFGLWKDIPSSALYIPLDLHTGNTARQLGLLTRNQNDWKAVEELTRSLSEFDPEDPVKYDFALFGIGINEK